MREGGWGAGLTGSGTATARVGGANGRRCGEMSGGEMGMGARDGVGRLRGPIGRWRSVRPSILIVVGRAIH